MMRLPKFTYVRAKSVREAVKVKAAAGPEASFVAGGTDLYPNMKRRQQTPKTVIALRQIEELARVTNGTGFTIGAGATLTALVENQALRAGCPGLWQAAAQIATPHLRNMGTIGGNLCLDTRCTYYDQSEEWRRAIGFLTCGHERSAPFETIRRLGCVYGIDRDRALRHAHASERIPV